VPNGRPAQPFGDAALIDATIEVLTQVRRAKTEAKQSQRAVVESLIVTAPEAARLALELGGPDLVDAGSIRAFTVVAGDNLTTEVVLAEVG
jgi:valyl-tRNA synthetase